MLLLVAWQPALAQGAIAASNPGFFIRHPLTGAILAGMMSTVIAVWATNRYLRAHYRQRIHKAFLQGREEAPQVQLFKALTPPTNYELKLREENALLKKQLQALTQSPTPAQPGPSDASATGAAPSLDGSDQAPADGPAPMRAEPGGRANQEPGSDAADAGPATTCYAPAQETGFLRDNKLASEPLPQLPLLLTLSTDDPATASFTLNPHVNQAKLIGDGLHQLSEFFDFELPTGRLTAVSADTPGQLARQGDGWQVVSRARLLVR